MLVRTTRPTIESLLEWYRSQSAVEQLDATTNDWVRVAETGEEDACLLETLLNDILEHCRAVDLRVRGLDCLDVCPTLVVEEHPLSCECERCGAETETPIELPTGETVCEYCRDALTDYDMDVIEAQINAMMGPQCGQVD